ncbi:hypothetical protein D0T12_18360 [Actinomadura spongiicola]|uniref:Uncharacterized protein n=1 Tax=Actinomadura spongiicola TaxID=2303421 RepID=A0A372GGC0_9ACTN|nr:hypothetical protein [Actinomadura spongiicola]RFS84123.1 hypothetical protein D0T12_18360 [Actinomadura spongiicola]
MIIPLRSPDGKPDYTRFAEWFALCDQCDAKTVLSRLDSWLIPRTTSGRIYCPRCACRTAQQLLTEAFPANPRQRTRIAVTRLRTALRGPLRRLTYRPRHAR